MSKRKHLEPSRFEGRTVIVTDKGALDRATLDRLESYGVMVIEKKPKAFFETHYLDMLKEEELTYVGKVDE